MPFLRVIRDKRGYETTYLMDWYHEAGRQRSRVIYAFRGPGGVRVGRVPLEPATMHEIEVRHPDVTFDWRAIFADRQVIESAPDLRRRRPRREEAAPETAVQPSKVPPRPQTSPPPPAAAHAPIPATLQGDTAETRVAFLAEWYPKVKERVEHRTSDPARREALLTLVERLNPSPWDPSTDLTEPLAHAAEALERLSRVLTRRRRRSGKRRPGAAEPGAVAARAPGAAEAPIPQDETNSAAFAELAEFAESLESPDDDSGD